MDGAPPMEPTATVSSANPSWSPPLSSGYRDIEWILPDLQQYLQRSVQVEPIPCQLCVMHGADRLQLQLSSREGFARAVIIHFDNESGNFDNGTNRFDAAWERATLLLSIINRWTNIRKSDITILILPNPTLDCLVCHG